MTDLLLAALFCFASFNLYRSKVSTADTPRAMPSGSIIQLQRSRAKTVQQACAQIPIYDIGGGDVNKMRRVVESVASQPGYGEDLYQYVSAIHVGFSISYPEDHPELGISAGQAVLGIYYGGGQIHLSTWLPRFWLESVLKHEMGHAKYGDDEDTANAYERWHC